MSKRSTTTSSIWSTILSKALRRLGGKTAAPVLEMKSVHEMTLALEDDDMSPPVFTTNGTAI
ncbi:hypothetical protein IAQ61_006969 [Plenodomus lingam]|uniref:uncharacterized protein n=1 Tax=Leptosphaeria maculans TaxID=5022 RepID=UPI0033262EBA|nr:hypothetical protein IAQ61_006969 [Plenodomus lingam]